MAQGNNQNQKRNSTFTNSWTTTYDGVMSSMSFKFIDDRGFIVLAPIHPNMIGKTPKAGEKVYDYDNAQSFWISPQMAIALKTGIQALLEQEHAEVPEFHQIQVGSGADNQRNLTIYAPRSIRLTVKGEKRSFPDNYLLKIQSVQDEEQIKSFHVLQTEDINVVSGKGAEKEESAITIHSDLELIIKFCDVVLDATMGTHRHTANYAKNLIGSAANNSNKGKKSNAFEGVDEDDDLEDEDEDSESTSTKKTAPKRPSPATSKKPNKSLSKSFDDEDEDEDDDLPM